MSLARTYQDGFSAGVAWGFLVTSLCFAVIKLKRGTMSRRNAKIKESAGFLRTVSRKTAYLLLKTGDFKIVQKRAPLIIEQDRHSDFERESMSRVRKKSYTALHGKKQSAVTGVGRIPPEYRAEDRVPAGQDR